MKPRLTTEAFVLKAKEVHGKKYMYNNCVYLHSQTKVLVTCPEHGDFETRPATFLQGRGCPVCANSHRRPLNTTEQFIKNAKKKHGNAYIYDDVQYFGCAGLVTIGCKLHGKFEQQAGSHVRGAGCPKCANDYVTSFTRKSTETFIKEAKVVHGNRYDYSKVQYDGWDTKVKIICPVHGEFLQQPAGHLKTSGCRECYLETRRSKK